jgi:ScaI restriction endonuclease
MIYLILKLVHFILAKKFSLSNPKQIFGNRSYAQPDSGKGQKNKDGYYITINFEKFDKENKSKKPKILLIRFGYIEHSDWIAQKASTGQQARLSKDVYEYKFKLIYELKINKE